MEPANRPAPSRLRPYLAITAILLVGAFLRWIHLAPLSDMLSYDEAYYGLDTLSLIAVSYTHLTLPTIYSV